MTRLNHKGFWSPRNLIGLVLVAAVAVFVGWRFYLSFQDPAVLYRRDNPTHFKETVTTGTYKNDKLPAGMYNATGLAANNFFNFSLIKGHHLLHVPVYKGTQITGKLSLTPTPAVSSSQAKSTLTLKNTQGYLVGGYDLVPGRYQVQLSSRRPSTYNLNFYEGKSFAGKNGHATTMQVGKRARFSFWVDKGEKGPYTFHFKRIGK